MARLEYYVGCLVRGHDLQHIQKDFGSCSAILEMVVLVLRYPVLVSVFTHSEALGHIAVEDVNI